MTYPNILILDYLKKMNKTTPEIRLKAENYINLGYQRLLTFEVRGGGFSWFGEEPANLVLSAYGLMQLVEMARVYPIDEDIIARTKTWLLKQQHEDGRWGDQDPRKTWSAAELESDALRLTAYIAWALVAAGEHGPAIDKALRAVTESLRRSRDPYTLALAANWLVDYDRQHPLLAPLFQTILDLRTEEQGHVYWKQNNATPTFGAGEAAHIEATALLAQSLIKWKGAPGLIGAILKYLIAQKDKNGLWYSTQATIQVLKALNLTITGEDAAEGTVDLFVDETLVHTLPITRDNRDLLHQFDLKDRTHAGAHRVRLRFRGQGSLSYQIVGRYYLPWSFEPPAQKEPLTIDLHYDKSALRVNDLIKVTARIRNNTEKILNMLILDLGVPPGFDYTASDFERLVTDHKIQKYSAQGPQIILYLDNLGSYEEKELEYWLRAKYPLKVQTPKSRLYEYYNPRHESFAKLEELQVSQ